MKNFKSCAIRIILLVLGVGSIILGVVYPTVDNESLIEVQGEAISSTLNYLDDSDTDTYNVTYSYMVDNIRYEGDCDSSTNYSPGQKIRVYYDPKSPDKSYYSKGEEGMFVCGFLIFGLICLGSLAWDVIASRFFKSHMETPVFFF